MVWLKDGKREVTRSGFKVLVTWFKVQALHSLSVINIAYKE